MRKKLILFLSILSFSGCAGQEKTVWSSTKIEYTTHSRGSYQLISIEGQAGFVIKNREEKPLDFKITVADWTNLNTAIQALDLKSLPDLKAPTKKRFFDGASSARLKISYKGKTYESQSFDHGYPPLEIKKIIDQITSFAQ